MAKTICWYLQMHQPWRIRSYNYFEIGRLSDYFDNPKNRAIIEKVNDKSYRPMLSLLNKLVLEYPQFRFALSVTGTLIEQWQTFSPGMIEKIQRLVATGQVELLAETYYHSLAYLWSIEEWRRQVSSHVRLMKDLFDVSPTVFRNTELVFENRLAPEIAKLGFAGTLVEGWDHVLGSHQPTYLYASVATPAVKLLTKHYRLSDDIAFRFSDRTWQFYPLHVNQYRQWLDDSRGEIINLFMDFETFGEHQWSDTGIFVFFETLVSELIHNSSYIFRTPAQICTAHRACDTLDIPYPLSWADTERDLSAWIGNRMQNQVAETLYSLEQSVMQTGDEKLLEDWRRLQTSDHFYYMCTKWFADGDVHAYFNPYSSPYDAYIYYQLILEDLKLRLKNSNVKIKISNQFQNPKPK